MPKTRKSSRKRSAGPDFGKLYKEKKNNRLLGFFLVLLISAVIGVGTYFIVDFYWKKQEIKTETPKSTPTPEVTQEVEPTPTPELTEGNSIVYPDGFMADFVDTREKVNAKAIYVNTAFLPDERYPSLDELIALADRTEINAMVIDIKDDYGRILYDSKNETVEKNGEERIYIQDLPAFVAKLKEHDIYCIARVVAFLDRNAVKKNPEIAVKNKDGSLFVDAEGEYWLNPYNEGAREYLVEVAKEAVEAGFDEINFDYLRISASGSLKNADFGERPEGMTHTDAIMEFVKYACSELKPMGAFVSGDVFGTIINSTADGTSIGQSYVELSRYLDYICPMVYPSHYSFGYGGIKYPDTQPYQLVYLEMISSVKKLSVIPEGEHKAEVRPWLQDFTMSGLGAGRYLDYGGQEIRAQISGVYSAGYKSWMLWDFGMTFAEDGLLGDKINN